MTVPPREPACQYPAHRPSDWALPDATIWTCGICHPPMVGRQRIISRAQQPDYEYAPTVSGGAPRPDLLTPRERVNAERYRHMYPWLT
jgi:hypothetical protein